jgi:MFS family permease
MILHGALRSLGSRNYRLFFTAQAISLTGLWMHRTAMGWLVYRLTNSDAALGLMDFAASFPIFLFTAFAGSMIEHWDLRKTLLYCQAACMAVALILAVTTLSGTITFNIVLCLSMALGFIDSFELPCRYSLVYYMVDRKSDVSNAVALNSLNFNTARMIGPTVGGFVIHAAGEGVCFLINALSYSSTLFAVKNMSMERPPIGRTDSTRRNPLADTIEGLKTARDFAPNRYLLLLISITGFFGFPSIVLMPAMAKSVLGGTPQTLGLLLMGVAVGALCGSLLMASLKINKSYISCCTRTCVGFGLSVLLFSLSRNIYMGIILAAPVGFCMVSSTIACNTLLQTMAPKESKSRIMALYTFALLGIPPFGSLLSGRIGDILGTEWALFISGAACAVTAYYFMKKISRLNIQIIAALHEQGVV